MTWRLTSGWRWLQASSTTKNVRLHLPEERLLVEARIVGGDRGQAVRRTDVDRGSLGRGRSRALGTRGGRGCPAPDTDGDPPTRRSRRDGPLAADDRTRNRSITRRRRLEPPPPDRKKPPPPPSGCPPLPPPTTAAPSKPARVRRAGAADGVEPPTRTGGPARRGRRRSRPAADLGSRTRCRCSARRAAGDVCRSEAQNLAPWGFSAWQLAHTTVGGASEVPQDAQNLAPAALAAWQLGHCDRRRWRPGPRTRRRRRRIRARRAAAGRARTGAAAWPPMPRPAARNAPPDRATALGHALAGPQGHLAGGVLLETAGQAGVGGVLGERLELRLVLLGEVDVEVTHPDDLDAVGGQLLVALVDHLLLDVGGVGGQAEDRPPVAHDLDWSCGSA